MIIKKPARRKFIVRHFKAYPSVLAVVGVVVAISELKGAGWRPALAGVPLYASLLILVTYAMTREFCLLKKGEKESGS
jgi:hypothetical protein